MIELYKVYIAHVKLDFVNISLDFCSTSADDIYVAFCHSYSEYLICKIFTATIFLVKFPRG